MKTLFYYYYIHDHTRTIRTGKFRVNYCLLHRLALEVKVLLHYFLALEKILSWSQVRASTIPKSAEERNKKTFIDISTREWKPRLSETHMVNLRISKFKNICYGKLSTKSVKSTKASQPPTFDSNRLLLRKHNCADISFSLRSKEKFGMWKDPIDKIMLWLFRKV